MTRKPRKNDAPWRNQCAEARGLYCRSCGESDPQRLECNHVWPKGQQGPSVVENGMFLCGWRSTVTPGGCHPAVTEARLLMRRDWLDPDQVAWLAEVEYVWWDDKGEVWGRGSRRFAPVRVMKEEEVAWPRI